MERSPDRPFRAEHEETLEAAHWIEDPGHRLVEVSPALYPFVRVVEVDPITRQRRGLDPASVGLAPHASLSRPGLEFFLMKGVLEAQGWRWYEIDAATGELIEHEAYPAARARARRNREGCRHREDGDAAACDHCSLFG